MHDRRLLLISRDDILQATLESKETRLFRELARLTRGDFHLLATAPQPDRWSSSHGGPDDALLGPDSIRKRLSDAGGTLDGVYYVPRSLLTQKRNRVQALEDILRRYSVSAERCYLISSHKNFVRAANSLGIVATLLSNHGRLMNAVTELSKKTLKEP